LFCRSRSIWSAAFLWNKGRAWSLLIRAEPTEPVYTRGRTTCSTKQSASAGHLFRLSGNLKQKI
jgi:hypothetical protein